MNPPVPRAEPASAWTILEVLKWTTARFAERGLPTPRLDAELLAAHAFEMSRVSLYTEFDRPLSPAELARFRELVKRRQAGEPVAYLTGRKQFWNLDLEVDRRVLVPRPDTETAVQAALEICRADTAKANGSGGQGPRIVDIGTGSGAIALVLKKELPHAEVLAVDSSTDALAVARANAVRLGLDVTFFEGDLLAPLDAARPLDLVIANLPYVPSGDIPALAPEVRSEPLVALDGGEDGLVHVRRLVAGAASVLRPGGALVLEVGIGQADAVVELCRAAGLVEPESRADLAGISRVVIARRPEGPS